MRVGTGLSNAERQAIWRAKRDAEIERLRKAAATKPGPAPDQAKELKAAHCEIACLQHEITRLKAKILKPVKVPLDPDSEAARRIDTLKKKNKTLQAEADKWLMKLKTLVPAVVKTKVAKALTEQTTSPQNRLDALQAWNGLGLNNIGK